MAEYIVIMSTVSSQMEASRIGEELINQKLAACVNVIPGLTSYYRWGGAAQTGKELLILVKTCKDNYERASGVIRKHHSYEVPEIIAIPIIDGDPTYLKWMDESCEEE